MKPSTGILLIILFSCNAKPVEKISSKETDSMKHATNILQTPDSLTKSERVDGPANIRVKPNGKLLFVLNDNAPVAANEAEEGWLQVGVIASISQKEKDSSLIRKGSKIVVDKKIVGEVVEDIHITSMMVTTEGNLAELTGYTFISNIKPNSIVENEFSQIVNSKNGPLTLDQFERFLKNFEFQDFDGLLQNFTGYEIDENWIDDPSPLLRLWLIFDKRTLVGVFHSRPLKITRSTPIKVDRRFSFTPLTNDQTVVDSLVKKFNSYIKQVD